MERYAVLVNTKGIAGKSHYLAHSQELPVMDFKYTNELLGEYRGIWADDEWRRLAVKSLETNREFVDSIDGGIEVIRKKLYPPKIDKCSDMLRKVCEKRMKEKYGKSRSKILLNRYEAEINSIIDNDFSVIYWFSHLLVKESIDRGYLVGSRGSVGSSFVAYLAGISEVNPLPPHYYCGKCGVFEVQEEWKESGFDLPDRNCGKCGERMGSDGHDIPFETFLGFEGNKVPDIDLNFSGEYQIKAHNFLLKYFGEQKVFRAGTIGTMAEKTAAAVVEKYIEEKGLGKFSKGKKVWLADKIVDVKRTTGQHPGGILVVPENMSIYDFSPINYPANDTSSDWYTTHFSFEDLHDALLKFDILGHDDPTTLKLLKESTGFDPRSVPCRDEKLVKLYSSCSVMGIAEGDLIGEGTTGALGLPEFGTSLTRKIIKACNPKTFADLIRISGFSHGTGVWKGNINELVKNGHALNSVITCRDDIMLYLLRMGINREDSFNITESIRKGRGLSDRYQAIMRENRIPEWYIESAKKISYIFPKAHATAYVLMSWRIAYYKLYHPLAFYSAYFTTSVDSFDMEVLMKNDPQLLRKTYDKLQKDANNPRIKLSALDKAKIVVYEVAYEFFMRGFRFENVCVNKSELSLFLQDGEKNTLRIPLKAVSGCGEHIAKSIVTGRKKGFYRSLRDLNERGGVTAKTMEKLKDLGILPDGFGAGDEIFDESGTLIKSTS